LAFKEYKFDAWRLWAAPANDAEAPQWVAKSERKACRRDTKRSLKRLRRLPASVGWISPGEIKRDWLRERCARCLRCPSLIKKFDITPRFDLLKARPGEER
jgi:hypothetical protein